MKAGLQGQYISLKGIGCSDAVSKNSAWCIQQHTLRFRRFALRFAVFCSSSFCMVTFCSCRCA